MAAAAATKKDPELNIFQRINAISEEAGALAPESKGGVPFAFRGIDGTVAHLNPFLLKYGVFAAPKVLDHSVSEREIINPQTGVPNGKLVKTTQVVVEYTFYAPDGTSVSVTSAGLADDFADRSTAQAMSVAYRVALLQLFHLPTHSKDPEETGQEVINERNAPTGGSAAPKAVQTAQRVGAASGAKAAAQVKVVEKLQQQAKQLGEELGKGSDDLNALLAEHRGEIADPFNDAGVMQKVVSALEAEKKAKA